jgi:hypothetical protein
MTFRNSRAAVEIHTMMKFGMLFWMVGLAVMSVAPAQALECPNPQKSGSRGALMETPATIASRDQTLAARGSAAIPTIIFSVRKRHPHASNAEITNYMITAYCPVLNRKSELSDDQRRAALEAFASQVRGRLQ